jgi:integrase
LTASTETKTVGGGREIDKSTAKGLLLQFGLYLDKEGYGKDSRYVTFIRMLLNSNCNIYDSENVKEVIAKKKWKNGTKMLCCYSYDALARMLGMSWVMPTYRQEEYLFFLPEEGELDALISATRSQRMRTYLQTLKEIWADPSEGLGLRWIDVDAKRNVIAINRPVKDHNPRELEVTPRLIAMISNLPKTSELIFPMSYTTMYSTFKKLRKRVAHNQQNPRILSIKLTTFRHWGGTQLAWLSNGNVLFVKEKLGHKKVENTMRYIARINWKLNQDFEVVTATTDEEIKKCGEAGYQKFDERTIGGTHISYYRRPKRFGSLKV